MIRVWPTSVPSFMQSISLQTTTDAGNATDIRIEADASILVNMSVWASIETLYEFA